MLPLSIPFRLLLVLVLTCAGVLAHGGADTSIGAGKAVPRAASNEVPVGPVTPAPALPAAAWRIPIHTQQADPAGGVYGWWAAGQSFKASFHDGFVFYPWLGPDYPENLPMRWTTESITVGGAPIAGISEVPEQSHTDWRYEYAYRDAGVTEAYEVREDGVEQLFVIHERPRSGGDLVVTGRIDTKLAPSTVVPAGGAHGALTFADQRGRELVRYGAAIAFDAARRSTQVRTAFDGRRVSLTVPGDWLADAVYPLTIDPLTSRVPISTGGMGYHTSIGRDGGRFLGWNLMLAVSRNFSSSDLDLYAFMCNDDFTGVTPVFTDITTQWSTDSPGVAFVAGNANRWTVCLERRFYAANPVVGRVRVYFHEEVDRVLNNGLVAFHEPAATTESDHAPAIGGTAPGSSGDNALLVFMNDPSWTGGPNSKIFRVLANAATRTLGTRVVLSPAQANFHDCDLPAVDQVSDGGTSSWIVAYAVLNYLITDDDYDILLNRVTSTGILAGFQYAGPDNGPPKHKLYPQVAGRGGRYLVSMQRGDGLGSLGSDIAIERFDWPENAASTTTIARKITAAAAAPSMVGRAKLVYDSVSRSHWTLVYEQGRSDLDAVVFVQRLGFTGGITEAGLAYSAPARAYMPSVTFNEDLREFALVYDTTETSYPLYAQRLQYPAAAATLKYGTSCGAGVISSERPLAGSEFFAVLLSQLPAGTPGVLYLTLGSASIPLGGAMPGCFFNVDPTQLLVTVPATVVGNAARLQFALPDNPVVIGDVFGQWIYSQPGLNPANLGATQGLRMQIR